MLSRRIRNDAVHALFAQSAPVLASNLVVAAVVAFTLRHAVPHVLLLSWMGAMTAMVAVRIESIRRYWRAPAADGALWGMRFVWGTASAGVLWGCAAALWFDAEPPFSEFVLTFAIGGMCAAAAGTLSVHLPAFFVFFLLALSPLVIRNVMVGDSAHVAAAGMLMAFGVFLQGVARNNQRSFSKAWMAAHENAELLERLSQAQRALEETNRELERKVEARTLELERHAEALHHARHLEALGRLAGGLAHDFNNLMTVILTHTSELKQRAQRKGDEDESLLDEMRGAALHGAALVNGLLAFSRQRRIEPRQIDLDALVTQMMPWLRRVAGESVQIVAESSRARMLVFADPAGLEELITNLCVNARNAMPRGGTMRLGLGVSVHSLPGAREPQECAVLSVSDSGDGMSEQTRRSIFEPFAGARGLGEPGLGLATAYGIVRQNGGDIVVASELGRGSEFRVFLPLSEASAEASRPRASTGPVRSLTILVAEDEPSVRAAVARCFRSAGHTVMVAEDGRHALEIAERYAGTIDVLVTDVVMPNLGGPELAERLARERPGVRVLFTTGHSFGATLPADDPTRGVAVLSKPFDNHALESKLRSLFGNTP
ncbi:MAG TPA: response regulator [Polyangiaceae bacterium]|nr:response regulator [Polyangiaceae bacterium]